MKHLLSILCLLMSFRGFTQTKDIYLLGEYHAGIVRASNSSFYNVDDGLATLDTHAPNGAVAGGSAGPHDIYIYDTAGFVYSKGDNTYGECGNGNTSSVTNFVKILVDSLGNPFRDVVELSASSTGVGWMVAARKKDGTVWIAGCTDAGLRGNSTDGGTTTRFVQIPMPEAITKIQIGFFGLVLGASGNVYAWGGHYSSYTPYLLAQGTGTPVYNTPTQITGIPYPAIDIASNGQTAYALTARPWGSGQLYGWAYWAGSLGVGTPLQGNPQIPTARTSPWLLDTAWTAYVPAGFRIKGIWAGSLTTYVIDSLSNMYAQGDNSNAGYGDGNMISWASYPSPFNWNQQYGDSARTFYRKPRQIGVGPSDWDSVMTGPALVFGATFRNKSNNLFGDGRNKGGPLVNANQPADAGNGNLQGAYPNSWMIRWLTKFFPYTISTAVVSTSQQCQFVPGAPFCSSWPWDGSKAAPTCNAGGTRSVSGTSATLTGTSSVTAGVSGIIEAVYVQLTGPTTAQIPYQVIQSGGSVPVYNLAPGIYTFSYTVMDSNFKTASDVLTLNVTALNQIVIPGGIMGLGGATRGRLILH